MPRELILPISAVRIAGVVTFFLLMALLLWRRKRRG